MPRRVAAAHAAPLEGAGFVCGRRGATGGIRGARRRKTRTVHLHRRDRLPRTLLGRRCRVHRRRLRLRARRSRARRPPHHSTEQTGRNRMAGNNRNHARGDRDRMRSSLAVSAIENAVAIRGDVTDCIVHSARGSQGGFNRSSQHHQIGGVRLWRPRTGARGPAMCQRSFAGSGVPIERCGRRCAHLGGRTRRGWCSASSGG